MGQLPAELPPPSGNGWSFFAVLMLVAACGYFLASLMQTPPQNDRHIPAKGPSLIGTQAPAIRASGWFNGTAPTEADLQGKVIVIDAWAFWCGPCRRKAPKLIRFYEEFAPQGVVFLGLTSEGEERLDRSREFIDDLRIPWTQGFGAVETLSRLNAEYIPQVWVIDATGKIVWDQTAPDDVDVTLRQLLK
jgi:thiol-disulfide isomerase/thioredoxin